MRVRHIELIGLPGAGKSNLLRGWDERSGALTIHQLVRRERVRSAETHHRAAIARRLPDAIKLRVLRGPEPDAYDTACFLAANRGLHDLVVERAARLDPDDQVVALWMLLEAWARHAYAARVGEPDDTLILDEGIWQRLAFLFAASSPDTAPGIPPLPDPLPALDGLVVLRVPLHVAVDRVTARAEGFQATNVMAPMERCIDLLASHLGNRGVPVEVLDAERPKPELVTAVRRFLAATSGP
jgi:hypothetical protein